MVKIVRIKRLKAASDVLINHLFEMESVKQIQKERVKK